MIFMKWSDCELIEVCVEIMSTMSQPTVDWTPQPHIILEASNFNFRYVRLWDLDIPREKWLNYLRTVETLIRRQIFGLRCLPITPLGVSRLQWVKWSVNFTISIIKYEILVYSMLLIMFTYDPSGFKFNFFDSLLKLASSIIFYLLNLSATCFFILINTVKCGLKP